MRRLRRVSVEVIRRELSMSVTTLPAKKAGSRPDAPGADERDDCASNSPVDDCPSCASPRFLLRSEDGDNPAFIQKALDRHGIHTQLRSTGELLVCARSFELHTGTPKITSGAVSNNSQVQSHDLTPGKSTHHD